MFEGIEGHYENRPENLNYANLDFEVNKDGEGYVNNGDWYFTVIEFKPPYMKIKIHHPNARDFVEYFDVVKV